MEAALRTAVKELTGSNPESVDFKEVRGVEGIKEASYDVAGMTVKVAVASGLGNARKLLEDVKAGKADYHFIERPHIPVQTTRRPCGRKFNIRVHSQFVGIIACDATFRICRTTIANLSRKWEKVPENTPPTQGFWRRYKLAHNSVSSHLSLILSGTGLCQRCC